MNNYNLIKTFAFFVGYPRSGHSLLGACLDAHPHAVVSHELDALALLLEGKSRKQLFDAICEKSVQFHQSGSRWSGYSYNIPGMWQGRFETLHLIGDKRGGTTTKHLEEHPGLMDQIKLLAPSYRIIHVTRNPFDCIASAVSIRERKQNKKFTKEDVLRKAGHFFQKARTIQLLMERENKFMITLRHEDLIREPEKTLTGVLQFLNLPVATDYLKSCCEKIWPSPKQSRQMIQLWDKDLIDHVQNQINSFSFFEGYNFPS